MKKVHGFTVVSGLFILVVLAVLAAFIVSVSSNQHVGAARDELGSRAYQAARAGVEWGLYRVNSTAAYNFSYGSPATQVGAASPNLRACTTAAGSFATLNFTVTVSCVRTPVDDAVANNPFASPAVYTITSTACNQPTAGGSCPNTAPGPLYIERRLEVSF
jgi:MSHA biogenesis protein MshP